MTVDRANRLLIADDSEEMLETLAAVLRRDVEIEIVATVLTPDALITAVVDTMPDVVLLDLQFGDQWGFDLIPNIRRQLPSPEVVVLSALAGTRTKAEAERSGAFRQLTKGCPISDIRNAVIEAANQGH